MSSDPVRAALIYAQGRKNRYKRALIRIHRLLHARGPKNLAARLEEVSAIVVSALRPSPPRSPPPAARGR